MRRIVALLALGVAGTLSAATIGIVPPTTTVLLGAPFTLDVNVTDVVDLYAYQFDVGFSPDLLSATRVTSGSFINVSFFPGFIDNSAGTVTFVADSLTGPVPGVSGSGTLASIQFLAIGLGTSPITLSNVILLDSRLEDISAAVGDGSVTVAAVPEPVPALLALSGFIAFAITRKRALAR